MLPDTILLIVLACLLILANLKIGSKAFSSWKAENK